MMSHQSVLSQAQNARISSQQKTSQALRGNLSCRVPLAPIGELSMPSSDLSPYNQAFQLPGSGLPDSQSGPTRFASRVHRANQPIARLRQPSVKLALRRHHDSFVCFGRGNKGGSLRR
ncbi:hypothetical protein N658DRAFT_305316 [Parathielavia hyrcaniae]|uniref:Uncharacterized protein n=1 Tax=Parathielavia hyrcaniae TaxID=113614 RepID=A0AAN6Q5F6_9PEZI|nr:hypothetical protein N658DRAFT_305316 [Parathielavia hyrcaniae]